MSDDYAKRVQSAILKYGMIIPKDHFIDPTIGKVTATSKVPSDGGTTSYYQFPEGATELNDLVEHKEMSFARGNIFKALYRLGEKEGIDAPYDLNKIQFFLDRLKVMHQRGQKL